MVQLNLEQLLTCKAVPNLISIILYHIIQKPQPVGLVAAIASHRPPCLGLVLQLS